MGKRENSSPQLECGGICQNTPVVTNDEAALALIGLIVVLARRKATMPAMLMLCPMRTRTRAAPMRT